MSPLRVGEGIYRTVPGALFPLNPLPHAGPSFISTRVPYAESRRNPAQAAPRGRPKRQEHRGL